VVERTERGRGNRRVSKLSQRGRPVRRGPTSVYPLFLLIGFSLLVAFLLTQTTVTLAYPSFQSPQSPAKSPTPTQAPAEGPTEAPAEAPTQAPAEAPTEAPAGPPEESPVVAPGETPIVPPAETPVLPPSGEETPEAAPEAAPGEEASPEAPTPTESASEEESSLLGRMSPAVLIDTCVVGLSSVWLCCGGFVLVVFVLLIAASFVLRVS
jgi:cytoskeletal protein RodZ